MDDEESVPFTALEDETKENEQEGQQQATKTKRVLRPQPKLNELRLCGENGIPKLAETFRTYTPDSRKDEFENLADVMGKVEHWAHNLYPKLKFDDFLSRVESLGSKRSVQICVVRLRLGEEDETKAAADDDDPMNNDDLGAFDDDENEQRIEARPSSIPILETQPNLSSFHSSSSVNPIEGVVQTDGGLATTTTVTPQQTDTEGLSRAEINRRRAIEIRAKRLAAIAAQAHEQQKEEQRMNEAPYSDVW